VYQSVIINSAHPAYIAASPAFFTVVTATVAADKTDVAQNTEKCSQWADISAKKTPLPILQNKHCRQYKKRYKCQLVKFFRERQYICSQQTVKRFGESINKARSLLVGESEKGNCCFIDRWIQGQREPSDQYGKGIKVANQWKSEKCCSQ
jgi:hypothetical protein